MKLALYLHKQFLLALLLHNMYSFFKIHIVLLFYLFWYRWIDRQTVQNDDESERLFLQFKLNVCSKNQLTFIIVIE